MFGLLETSNRSGTALSVATFAILASSAQEDDDTLELLEESGWTAGNQHEGAYSGACCPSGSCCASGSCCQSGSACVATVEFTEPKIGAAGKLSISSKRLWPIPV